MSLWSGEVDAEICSSCLPGAAPSSTLAQGVELVSKQWEDRVTRWEHSHMEVYHNKCKRGGWGGGGGGGGEAGSLGRHHHSMNIINHSFHCLWETCVVLLHSLCLSEELCFSFSPSSLPLFIQELFAAWIHHTWNNAASVWSLWYLMINSKSWNWELYCAVDKDMMLALWR